MKDTLRVALVQLAPDPTKPGVAPLVAHVEAEAASGADLVLLPELATVGSPAGRSAAELRALAEPVPGPTTEALAEVAARLGVHVLAGVLEAGADGKLYSSAVLVAPSGLVGAYRRLHLLPAERELFAAGDVVGVFPTEIGTIAVSLSYDVSFPELARVQALEGAEILASLWGPTEPEAGWPEDAIVVQCRSRATENFVYVLGCNAAGGSEPRASRSVIASCNGEAIAQAESGGEEVVRGEITDRAFREQRMYLTIFRDRRPELYGALVEGP
jgi:predicted amidohydrolase